MEYVPGKIEGGDMLFFFLWLAITPLVFIFAYSVLFYLGNYSPHHAMIATWNELYNAWDEVEGDYYFTDEGAELL
jgi:hypothetical protein